MTTSDSERRAWTMPGAQDAAQRTYASVRAALDQSTQLRALAPEVFLQGSYANATNIRGDSDVDIVVMSPAVWEPGTQRLDARQKLWENIGRHRAAPNITPQQFRIMVHQALTAYYGAVHVHSKPKCLRVDKRDGYVDADVVPAAQYRLYTSYELDREPSFIEGISITPVGPDSNRKIVNYPKEHIKNGQAKNKACLERYKPGVRQVKQLRHRAVNQGLLAADAPPGYLLECLLYNVPDHLFLADDSARLSAVLAWLRQQQLRTFQSGDEIHWLFIDDPGQHDANVAHRTIEILWSVL